MNWMRATAVSVARRAAEYDRRMSDRAWHNWINEGPAKSIGRHHKLTRVDAGWVPSTRGVPDPDPAEDDDDSSDADVAELQIEQAEVVAQVLTRWTAI